VRISQKEVDNLLRTYTVYGTIRYRGHKKQKMENSKAQLLERLKTANNILVTVSSNPSVDQLSAAIGLTLMLNKIGKQGTAVFSGKVPSTIEFLQPEKTIEKNTDSLRDFIIALDKSKADKLRYKVEDSHVKIFITPYRTALSDKDLQFSQGDFNVEVVIALGVKDQNDLDRAITAHGRILHDATTISVTNGEPGTVGSIDWDDPKASSLSEMVASLASELGQDSLDGQIATSLMTGIVAQTERFRNARTAPSTMSIASSLMAAGANQQLIATKLEQTEVTSEDDIAELPELSDEEAESGPDDTSALRIEHEEESDGDDTLPPLGFTSDEQPATEETAEPEPETEDESVPEEPSSDIVGGGSLILDPPTLGGQLTANTETEHLEPPIDALGVKDDQPPILERQEGSVEDPTLPSDLPPPTPEVQATETTPAPEAPVAEDAAPEPVMPPLTPAVPEPVEPPMPSQDQSAPPDVSDARDAVSDALTSLGSAQPLPPITALNAQPFDINDQLGSGVEQPAIEQPIAEQTAVDQDFFTVPPASDPVAPAPMMDQPVESPVPPESVVPAFTMPENLVPPAVAQVDNTAAPDVNPSAPPAVPPPFMPNMPGFDPSAATPPQQDNSTPQAPAV
jgi:hypothetical protein